MARGSFLDTSSRRELLAGLPVHSVPVLARAGKPMAYGDMVGMVCHSAFKTPDTLDDAYADLLAGQGRWKDSLRRACALVGDDFGKRLAKMDGTDMSEGLYVKLERDGEVVGRYKWVRPGFTQVILAADEHWQSRFPVPNLLEAPADGFPLHLARSRQPAPAGYDADKPWEWAPWTPASPASSGLTSGL